MDLTDFLSKISIWAIPVLFAVTLQEAAHGWAARYVGDRTAELLGCLSVNPLRRLDPVGTALVPGLLLAFAGPLLGWAKPVPVAARAPRNRRRVLAGVPPQKLGTPLERVEPAGIDSVFGYVALVITGPLGDVLEPACRLVGQPRGALLRSPA